MRTARADATAAAAEVVATVRSDKNLSLVLLAGRHRGGPARE
ncbi:hypothetical protein KPATCC21470_0998 [Kitasatospora purpeofusca]